LRTVSIIAQGTAIPLARRRHLRKKYNTVLIACETPAARRWLPQALALPIFFATFLSKGKRLRCGPYGALCYGIVMMEAGGVELCVQTVT